MIEKKRAQSPTIGVIIAIVLGVALIVFLIWGFSTNWSMFSSTAGSFSGSTNVDSIQQACQMHCENNRIQEFCISKRQVIMPDKTKITDRSCYELYNTGVISISCPNLDQCPSCNPKDRENEDHAGRCSEAKTETDCKKITSGDEDENLICSWN